VKTRAERWKGLPILSELPEPDCDALEEEIEEQTLEPGVRLFSEGEPGGSLWILLEGRVRVLSRRLAFSSELGAGTALGGLSLLGGTRRASVETASRCRLLRLGRDGFRRVAAGDPALAERLVESLAREAATRADEALAARVRAGVDPASADD
jgi:CRP/FNR family cyclic AMP-dependent transcriptional regulator